MLRLSRLTPALAVLALSACSWIEPAMLSRLRALDPITANPSDIVARVNLPDGLDVAPNGAVIEFTARRSDSSEIVSGWYPLERSGELWRISSSDVARIRDIQAQLQMWENEAPAATEGKFRVHVEGCTVGAGPDPSAPVRVDLSLDGGTRFQPFIRNITAGEVARVTGDGGQLSPCESA